jgi:hypothetical protein
MRIAMFLVATSLATSLGASLGACKWSEFDDLAGQTWVDSTEKPGVKSSDYGVAIQRGASAGDSGSSGTLAVLGAGPGTYSELAYNTAGSASFKINVLTLSALGIMTLDSPPIFLASPTSSEVALVTTGDTGSIVVAIGTHTLEIHQLFVGNTTLASTVTIPTTPDAATYMHPPPFPVIATPPDREPLVAVGDVVMGTVYGLPTNTPQPACKLTDAVAPTAVIQVRALGVVSNGTTDDVLVWNGTGGKLLRYPATVFNGCPEATPQVPSIAQSAPADTPAFAPGHGSQILTIDATRVLLQGHQDLTAGNASFLQVYDATTLKPLGKSVAKDGMRSAALLSTPGGDYAVVGLPNATLDGTAGGQVELYRIAPGGGLVDPAVPVAILHDVQPDSNELFGRSVAVVPFNGKQVIAVAADNEVFMYFRANLTDGTALYDETRQGR